MPTKDGIKISIKDEIKKLLEQGKFDKLVELARREKSTIRHLTSFLYSEDNLLHWRAVEGLELIAKAPDILSDDKIHTIINRFFIALNDQSGGNGWGSMEAIGALISTRPDKLSSLIPKMFAHISDGRIWVGLLWSIRKIGEKQPDLFKDKLFHVLGLLRSPRPSVRGHAVWALGAVGDAEVREFKGLILDVKDSLEGLLKDNNTVRIYYNGNFHEKTVGNLAKEALATIAGGKVTVEKPD